MLQQILEFIHNRFIETPYVGEYTIQQGVISPLDFLKEGQRFWIVGSSLNDAVYTYHSNGCKDDDDKKAVTFLDEEFAGTICALAIPKAVLDLSTEIGDWNTKYGGINAGPYTSESFGGYSYTKATRSGGTGAGLAVGWQQVFADRLNTWRKLC